MWYDFSASFLLFLCFPVTERTMSLSVVPDVSRERTYSFAWFETFHLFYTLWCIFEQMYCSNHRNELFSFSRSNVNLNSYLAFLNSEESHSLSMGFLRKTVFNYVVFTGVNMRKRLKIFHSYTMQFKHEKPCLSNFVRDPLSSTYSHACSFLWQMTHKLNNLLSVYSKRLHSCSCNFHFVLISFVLHNTWMVVQEIYEIRYS